MFPSGPQFTESAQESAIVDQLAFSPFVLDLITQPTIRFEHEGRRKQYSADVFVEYGVPGVEPERFMVEAKLQQDIERNADEHKARFDAAKDWCRANGASFCLLDERDIKTTYLTNVRKLGESRATAIGETALAAIPRLRLTKSSTVLQAASQLQDLGVARVEALVAIEKAVIDRILDCDLTKPFGGDAVLRHQSAGGGSAERADPFLAILRKAGRRGRLRRTTA